MNIPQEKCVDIVGDGQDLFTSSVPYTLHHARQHTLVKAGGIALIMSVGSGMQVACAFYYF